MPAPQQINILILVTIFLLGKPKFDSELDFIEKQVCTSIVGSACDLSINAIESIHFTLSIDRTFKIIQIKNVFLSVIICTEIEW